MKPRVFISGPYTKPDPVLNVRRAVEAADQLLALGCAPYIPHLTHTWHMISPKDYEEWMAIDFEWIRVCHAVLRIHGESPGADKEVEFAQSLGVPVFFSVGELVAWLDKWSSSREVSGQCRRS